MNNNLEQNEEELYIKGFRINSENDEEDFYKLMAFGDVDRPILLDGNIFFQKANIYPDKDGLINTLQFRPLNNNDAPQKNYERLGASLFVDDGKVRSCIRSGPWDDE